MGVPQHRGGQTRGTAAFPRGIHLGGARQRVGISERTARNEFRETEEDGYPDRRAPLHKLQQLGLGRARISQHQEVDVPPASESVGKPEETGGQLGALLNRRGGKGKGLIAEAKPP